MTVRQVRSVWQSFAVVVGVLCSFAMFGCGKESRVNVTPVHGRIIFGGHGVPNATVIFHPSDGSTDKAKRLRPFAYADGQGNFSLKTYVTDDGAAPGKYRVSIVVAPGESSGKTKDGAADAAAPASAVRIPSEIANKFANVDTSGIEVTVQEGENNLPPFELK